MSNAAPLLGTERGPSAERIALSVAFVPTLAEQNHVAPRLPDHLDQPLSKYSRNQHAGQTIGQALSDLGRLEFEAEPFLGISEQHKCGAAQVLCHVSRKLAAKQLFSRAPEVLVRSQRQ